LLATIPALLIGGGWYFRDFIAYGSPTGSGDAIALSKLGGLIPNLISNFSIYTFFRDIFGIAVSWSWAGSWSLVRVSPWLHIPLLLVTAWLIVSYFLAIRRNSLVEPVWLPAWLAVPLLAGLLYHVLIVIALASNGTPGWYLNILAPFLAFAMGIGIERIWRRRLGQAILKLSLIYAISFIAIVMWSQMALFSGCAIKDASKLYKFHGQRFCLDRLTEVTNHLSVVGWPALAFVAFAGGFLCFVLAWRTSPVTLKMGKLNVAN
jgi:hypothetical protein